MITEDQKIAFKEILGSHYSAQVVEVLEERGVTDTNGKTHSNRMIVQVFNGETSHALIEDAIVEAVARKKKQQKAAERKKARLLQ